MAYPSKFNADRKEKILQALSVGASRTTAAHIAGVDEGALRRWLLKGKDAAEGTMFREFYLAVMEAEAAPRMRALGVVYREMPDRPDLAWKFIERREPGYAPPMPTAPGPAVGPVVIQLALNDGAAIPAPASEIIEGEVLELEPNREADSAPGT